MPIHLPPVSRRRFLAGALTASASLVWPRGARTEEAAAAVDPNRFILLSDTHVWEHRDQEHHGVSPFRNFLQARGEFLDLTPRPAGALVSGDCAFMEGHAADYAVLAELVEPIRQAGIPLWFALGNHDDRGNFYGTLAQARPAAPPVADKHVSVIDAPHARWFLLDSLEKTNWTPGLLGPAQLQWLADALDRHADKPALVVAHHNPEPGLTGGSGLRDTDALFDVLAPRPHVKAYFYGHTHCWGQRSLRDLHIVNLPTLVWLFDPTQPRGWVDAQLRPDGIRLELHALNPAHPAHGQVVDLAWRA